MEHQKTESVDFSIVCKDHPRYSGLRRKRSFCPTCEQIYKERKASNVSEIRIRKAGRGTEQRQELNTESTYSYVENVTDLRIQDNSYDNPFKEVARRLYEKNKERLLESL